MLDDTLASVLRYRPDNCQVILVHDGTYEDPYGLEGEIEMVTTPGRGQLIRLFNCGLSKATGEFIALIRPGIELDESWEQSVESAFENPAVGSVSPIIASPATPQTMVAAGITAGFGFRRKLVGNRKRINARSLRRIKPLGPTSWAAFYRRSALDLLGAVDEQLDSHYLDVEIALGLSSLGFENRRCDSCIANIDQSELMLRESVLPHGKSAQRAIRRHATTQGQGSFVLTLGAVARELVAAPVHPANCLHAIQRLGALTAAKVDRQFAERIALAAKRNHQAEGLGIRIHQHDAHAGKLSPQEFTTLRDRNAA